MTIELDLDLGPALELDNNTIRYPTIRIFELFVQTLFCCSSRQNLSYCLKYLQVSTCISPLVRGHNDHKYFIFSNLSLINGIIDNFHILFALNQNSVSINILLLSGSKLVMRINLSMYGSQFHQLSSWKQTALCLRISTCVFTTWNISCQITIISHSVAILYSNELELL